MSKNDYVIMTGNSMIMTIEKPRRVKKVPDQGCSKSERDEWMNFKSNKMLCELKKQKETQLSKEKTAHKERKKQLNEFLFHYGLEEAILCQNVNEYPEKCLECGSLDYYKKSHIDDINLICGVCGRPAFTLPGHGYDWEGKLKGK